MANPIAAVLSGAMMLEWLGYEPLGSTIRRAVDEVCGAGIATPDIGGHATTAEVTEALVQRVTDGAAVGSPTRERDVVRRDHDPVPTHRAPAVQHRNMLRGSPQGQASNEHVPT
jgi:hypothetical protein